MSIVIEQEPIVEIPTGEFSNLVAAHNPIRVVYRRIDDYVKASTDDGYGNTLLGMTNNYPANLAVGDLVYINDGGDYVGVYTVLQLMGGTDFVINAPYVGAVGAGYVNYLTAYKNYFLRINVTRIAGNGTQKPLGSSIVLPFSDGRAEHDLMGYAKIAVAPTDAVTALGQTNVMWCDNDNNCHLVVQVFENFNGIEPESVALEYEYNIANAAMSYHHQYGVNMRECYGGFLRANMAQTSTSRFLMPYSKLRVWQCLPEYVVFFHLGGNGTVATRIEYKKYNNGSLTQGGATYVTTNAIGSGASNGASDYIHGVALDVLTSWGLADTQTVQIVNNNNYTQKYTELLTFRLSCDPRNPVKVRALNRYGGWSYFVFGAQQTMSITTTNGTEYSYTPASVIEINADGYLMGKGARKELTVGADDLDKDDLVIVQEILTSPCVQVHGFPEDYVATGVEPSWLEVKIAAGGYVLQNTKSNLHRVEFKIIFSELNVQTR